MSSKFIAIVAGVGPGTGASVARKFAASYPVVLMARKPENYEPLVEEINSGGGKAIGISTDVSDAQSVSNAVAEIKKAFGDDVAAAAAIVNASGFGRKPFLETTEEEFMAGLNVSGRGSFLLSKAALPLLLKGVEAGSKYPPTLIFTGATASVRGSAMFGPFAAGMFAKRALAQSLAREFMPKGIHVSHVVVDGVIDIPRTKEMMQNAGPDAKMSPEAIADAYWHLHTQPRSTMTAELDMRPWVEKW